MDRRPRSQAEPRAKRAARRGGSGSGPSCVLRELHDACEVAEAVRRHGGVLAKPKPCLLTQKWLTPREQWPLNDGLKPASFALALSKWSNRGPQWQQLHAAIQHAAKQKLHSVVVDSSMNFLLALAKDAQFARQSSLLLRLLRLVERSVYISEGQEAIPGGAHGGTASAPLRIPYFVGHRWLSTRLLQMKRKSISMSEVIRRCQRFENIRVQVQGRLMELDRRGKGGSTRARGPAMSLAKMMQMPQEEEEEEEVRPKENLDVAADRLAMKLAAGRSGGSSLIWLWGVWKLMHALLMRRRRKKGELLQRTLIGDLVAPFRHWMIFAVENRGDSKLITYHTYLQERQMYTRTAMDLHNKKEDLVLDLQVSTNSCRRLTKQLDSKRRERQQLHQRLHDIQPEVMRSLLSRVLDLTLLEMLHTGGLECLRFRINFLTRDLAPLLLPDEDSPWRLFGFTGDQVLTRWSNHELAQFKLVANEVLEAMSKRNSEDTAEELEIEWSARETEIYGDRCRQVRNMKQLAHLEDDHEGVLLAVVYGAVCATGSLPHPVTLWPLDEKEADAKALSICKAIRQVIPTRAQYLLQPGDVAAKSKGGLIPALLAVIFMTNPTLPCSAKHEVLHAASFSINSAISQEAHKEPRKKKGQGTQDLAGAPVDLEPKLDAYQRAKDIRRRIQLWLVEADDSFNFEAPTTSDPVPKSIFLQIEALAGPWAIERPQDFTALLDEDEAPAALLTMPAHDLLLRWVNFHLRSMREDPMAGLRNLGELDLGLLLELLTKVAPDVLQLHDEEQTALRVAHNATAAEACTVKLVVRVAQRCTGYEVLTEEVLNDEQTDMMASFLAELMASFRAHLPVQRGSSVGQHMERLSSIVLEAANTETSDLVSGLCTYLRDHQESLRTSLEVMQAHHRITQAVQSKLRSFALKVLVKRSQGVPCDMLELAQQVPEGGQRGDLVASNNIQATVAREMARIPSQGGQAELELQITFEKSAVEELMKKHIVTLRDVFRLYAREATGEPDGRVRTSTMTSSMTVEAAHVLVVSPRHFMKLYRDCRLHVLQLAPVEVEEIYHEVKMHHALKNFEESQRFDTGLSLEMFVEALLTLACRAHVDHCQPSAFHEKLDYVIEKHLVPFGGSKQDDVVYQLLVDETLDELIDDFSPRLRSIFVAFASEKDMAGSSQRVERQRGHRGAMTKETVMAAAKQKTALTMTLDSFTEMLSCAKLLSETIHRACVGRIFMNLLKLRTLRSDDLEDEEDGVSPAMSEDPDHFASLMEEDEKAGASFQYSMSFQEFLDGLIILTLFKEPNPFVSFNTRLEKFFRSCLLDPLFDFANRSREPRFRSLYQALDDAYQKDMSASGIAKKIKMADQD